MNNWQKYVESIGKRLRDIPTRPTDDPDISAFEALEREISVAVDELYAGRLEKDIRSLAERAPTLESLEKIETEVQAIFREVTNQKLADVETTKFWSLLNHAGDGVLTADADTGRILDVNETIVGWLDYTRDELLRFRIQEIEEHPPSAPAEDWKSWVGEIKAGEEPFQIERTFRRKDGGSLLVELSIVHRMVEDQDCLVIFARDITERKKAEGQLRHQEKFLGRLLDGSVDGTLAFDRRCKLTFCNSALERFLGVDKLDLVGNNAWEVLPFLKELGEDQYFYEALAGKKVTSKNRFYTIPGSTRQVVFDGHYSPLLGASEEVVGGIGVIREVTGRWEAERALSEAREELETRVNELISGHGAAEKRLEGELGELKAAKEALRKSEGTFRSIVENHPDVVITVNRDGQILYGNRAWPDDGEEESGTTDFYRLVHIDSHKSFRNGLDRVFQTGERNQLDLAAVNGTWYESRIVPLLSGESVVAAMIIFTETSDSKDSDEEQLRLSRHVQPEHEMENLAVVAGGVAREYDELLTDVLGHVGSVLEELPPDSSVRYSVEQIESAALRATELTNQVQAYSGEDLPNSRLLDLSRLVEEMTHALEMTVPPSAILEKRGSDISLAIRADADQIRQLVMSLVTNASEALADHEGIITVATGTMEASCEYLSGCLLGEGLPEASYVYLEVSDTGKGMEEETLARVFVPFYTTKATSAGLGLATVVGAVRRHNGAIRAKSTPHQGTSIRVLFPQHGMLEEASIAGQGRSRSKPE